MHALLPVLHSLIDSRIRLPLAALAAVLACALLSPLASAQSEELMALTEERQALTLELEQYQKTLDILHTADTPARESDNPAVRKLAEETVTISERLVAIARREVILLQQQINVVSATGTDEPVLSENSVTAAAATSPENQAIESKPLRTMAEDDALARETADVKRLQGLLNNFHTQMRESARTMPSEEEIAQREAARIDARKLAKIPFSVDKVRLNGAEGSTALGQISERLSDPALAESRRDVAPICSIKTYLHGSLVGSDNRSLTPVGKNHFVAKIRLQPGDTTLRIHDHRWEVRLPQNVSASDFIVTFYNPPGSMPELHIFSVEDLLAQEAPHIPAWLPADIKISSRAE